AARDADQVQAIGKLLQPLGIAVDLPTHFGFVQDWLLLGPFDNTGGKGFQMAYGPEQRLDLTGTVKGKNNLNLRWKEYQTKDPFGLVDLNKGLGKEMAAVGYAYTVLNSPIQQSVEFRAGSNNALRI